MESDCDLRLSDVAELKGGFAFKSGDYSPEGHFVLRTVNIRSDGRITKEGAVFIPDRLVPEYERFQLQDQDTLFVMVGATLGKVGYVTDADLPALLNQNMWVIRSKDPDQANPRFLNYWFQHVVGETLAWASGSARGFVRRDDYRNLDFPSVPVSEQKAIAHILGSLDDRIELNRRMNATLEGMAQALFKSWFVDFDPVIDNALVAGNPIPEELTARAELRRTALDNGTANRETAKPFPDAFVETEEMGWIPDGWDIQALKDCTSKIGSGSTPRGGKSGYIERGTHLVRSQNVHDSQFRWEGIVCIDDDAAEKLKGVTLTANDVLINITGDSILRTCVVDPSVLPARVNQHVAILRPKDGMPKHYLHQFIVRDEYKTYLIGFDAGGSRHAITKGHLEEAEILVPWPESLRQYENSVATYFERRDANAIQSRSLTKLRDTLLPKLISGELRIPDAEKLAEAALA